MKKLLLLLLLLPLVTFSQDLNFLNIPISGHISNFTKQILENTPYTKVSQSSTETVFKKTFLNQERFISVYTEVDGSVIAVAEFAPSVSSWKATEENYNNAIAVYTHKYGKSSRSNKLSIQSISELYKIQKLTSSQTQYSQQWIWKSGLISVSIFADSPTTARIIVNYVDNPQQ